MQHDGTAMPAGQARFTLPRPGSPLGYTPAEVAEILGKSRNTIYAWMKGADPLLTSQKRNGQHYIPIRDVRALLDPELVLEPVGVVS